MNGRARDERAANIASQSALDGDLRRSLSVLVGQGVLPFQIE
jgi:hypothetical protein